MATPRTRAPPLLHPGTSTSRLSLAAQVLFDPVASTPPYVLHVVPLPSTGYLLAGSDDSLRTFSPTLEPLSKLNGTQKGYTSVVAGAGEGSTAVFTTAKDGTVAGWDTRDLTREAFKLKGRRGAPYLTCSQSSDLAFLAVGTAHHQHESSVEIWDLRAQAPTWSYVESHSDDLTNLSFHPSQSHLLLSGSVDGLINTFDVRIEDEDEALLATAQVGSSVLSCGWMDLDGSGSMSGVWGSTTIETVQTWKFQDNEFDMIIDVGDIREACLEPWRSDFLIDAHYNPSLGGLCLLTGTQKGDVALVNIKDPENWVLEQVLACVGGRTLGGAGHADIVRCAHLDPKTSTIVTGGEDGRVCLWKL